MVAKFVMMVTYPEELPLIHLHDHSLRWSFDNLNTLYLHLQKTDGHQNTTMFIIF